MKTILDNINNDIVIKNSRFICFLIKLDSIDIDEHLNYIKSIHPKATHYCYGYIYDEIKRSSDDNEPSGTAGVPILNVLEKENLNHILVIVVRYFGGIKLGAGGLVRAYTKSVTETLKNARFVDLVRGLKISLRFDYNEEKNVNYILRNSLIIKKEYQDDIYYECLVEKNLINNLNKYTVSIIEEIYIEKVSQL